MYLFLNLFSDIKYLIIMYILTFCKFQIFQKTTNLSKDCVLLLKFFRFVQREKELTGVIILSSICHGNKATSIEFETLMKFILDRKLRILLNQNIQNTFYPPLNQDFIPLVKSLNDLILIT